MFDKILIANRGEIACRVIRTAREMGIGTVAIYSDADARAKHVHMADEAIRVGAAPATESYLDIERIVAACREAGAQAVHPGYGFLSERAEFAEALEAAGIVFIGPPMRAIEVMGDKIESKRFAAKAGVNTVPGHDGVVADAEEAVEIAAKVGLPVMIKASAGGGGKGMRIAHSPDEVREGFERARSEAASSFGDDRIFIERFITQPRHIEIQVMADGQGGCIHLGERECSIQRRNQKVLEEAPSPYLDEATRSEMGAQAVALARAIDYRGAGTVEFIVDGERNFYFLEMNTRLQVEHPVTELVTGFDLVEHMIRVAAGERLSIAQDDVRKNGWAIEARVYAEDPVRGFLPSTGRLVTYRTPSATSEGARVRVDDGVVEGSEVSIHYDPMIAKLCTWAPDRDGAVDAMADALDGFAIEGVGNNLGFLGALMAHPRWRRGELTTGFIAEEFPDGFRPVVPDETRMRTMAAIALTCAVRGSDRLASFGASQREFAIVSDTARLSATGVTNRDRAIDGDLDGQPIHVVSDWRSGDRVFHGTVNGETVVARVVVDPGTILIEMKGSSESLQILPPGVADLLPIVPAGEDDGGANELRCPMPGTLVDLRVEQGQKVSPGDALAVVEAMKMENVLRAEREGVIASIDAAIGDGLAVDQRIMTFEAV